MVTDIVTELEHWFREEDMALYGITLLLDEFSANGKLFANVPVVVVNADATRRERIANDPSLPAILDDDAAGALAEAFGYGEAEALAGFLREEPNVSAAWTVPRFASVEDAYGASGLIDRPFGSTLRLVNLPSPNGFPPILGIVNIEILEPASLERAA